MENQTKQASAVADTQGVDDEINLMDLLLVIAKHNRFIIKLTMVVATLAVIASLVMANIYTSKTVILPPQQGSSTASMLLGQLGGLGGLAGGALGVGDPADIYVGILKSRTVADRLIQRYHLQALYKTKTMVETRAAMESNAAISSSKDGFITIEYSDEDPKLAASIANAYVEELDRLNQTLAVTEAARRRLFFEKQIEKSKESLVSAEVALKETQEKTGLIQLNKQGEAIIEAVAALRAQIAAKEVELTAMRAYATEQNPDYRQIIEVVTGLKVQLSKVERDNVTGRGGVMVPTGKVPELGLAYMRKMRDVKYQETLFELLSKQFEIAKLDEAKESAIIQVVDKALPSDKKSKPKRAMIVLFSTFSALIISIFLAFFIEAREGMRNHPELAERMRLLSRYLRQGH